MPFAGAGYKQTVCIVYACLPKILCKGGRSLCWTLGILLQRLGGYVLLQVASLT
jgi:hypothetical protein